MVPGTLTVSVIPSAPRWSPPWLGTVSAHFADPRLEVTCGSAPLLAATRDSSAGAQCPHKAAPRRPKKAQITGHHCPAGTPERGRSSHSRCSGPAGLALGCATRKLVATSLTSSLSLAQAAAPTTASTHPLVRPPSPPTALWCSAEPGPAAPGSGEGEGQEPAHCPQGGTRLRTAPRHTARPSAPHLFQTMVHTTKGPQEQGRWGGGHPGLSPKPGSS